MEKTLGGDRLGSGKKMKVHLHNYERSTHDLGYLWRSTMAAGTLVPFMSEVALPGDTFDINLEADIKTHPTIGPLFGSYKVQLDIFQAPLRLYHSALHNNALNIGRNMAQIKLPIIEMTALPVDVTDPLLDVDNSQINPSCLLSYLGMRGIGITAMGAGTQRRFNAVPILAYWEIYKNYYANKQEEIGAVIHTPSVTPITTITTVEADIPAGTMAIPFDPAIGLINISIGDKLRINFAGAQPDPAQVIIQTGIGNVTLASLGTGWTLVAAGQLEATYNQGVYGDWLALYNWRYVNQTDVVTDVEPIVATFPLENIDEMREAILAEPKLNQFEINSLNKEPYKWLYEIPVGAAPNSLSTQEGLAVKTYQSDLFNNWLSTDWIDGAGGITDITSIDTSGGSFSIDTLNLSKKVYDMLNRIAVSGGSYDDWLDAVYAHKGYQKAESPIYHGGLIKELVFQEVVSNSASAEGEQPLGTLAGKGVMGKKHKGGYVVIKVDEPSYIIGLISLTPRIDYSQGNKWDIHLETMDDFHKPALDEIGFQELITEQMAWFSTAWNNGLGQWVTRSAGKQPAWINYMTNVNQTRGNFAISTNEMFMTLNRRYEPSAADGIEDLTTYIDPSKFNFIFAQTSIDAQNFWAQIAVDITARRKMSARIMPNL